MAVKAVTTEATTKIESIMNSSPRTLKEGYCYPSSNCHPAEYAVGDHILLSIKLS